MAEEVFGDATLDSRYVIFSATKPFVASTVWTLMAEGLVDITEPVTTYFADFGAEGKQDITVEQVMQHTSGFPPAPVGSPTWAHRGARKAKMASWRLNWEPVVAWLRDQRRRPSQHSDAPARHSDQYLGRSLRRIPSG